MLATSESAPASSALAEFDNVQNFTLTCGARVVILPRPGSPNVAYRFYVGCGSQFESEEEHGLTHLLEHSLFKSTRRRAGADIYAGIENLGGQLNAHTHREYLVITGQVCSEEWQPVLEILTEVLTQPAFDHDLIEAEKKVVQEEIRRKQDNQNQIWDLLLETIWGVNSFSRVILGTAETVAGFDAACVRTYYERHFTGPNTVIAVVGGVDPAQVVAVLEEATRHYPAQLNGTPRFNPALPPVAPVETPHTVKIRKNSQLTTVLAGWPTVTQYDRVNHSRLKLLNRILGVGGTGWFRQELREKNNIVYNVQSLSTNYASRGYFAAMLSVQPSKVDYAIDLLREQIGRIIGGAVDEQTLENARRSYVGSLGIFYETNMKLAENLGVNALTQLPATFRSTVEQIQAVRATDLQAVAASYLNAAPYVALLGI